MTVDAVSVVIPMHNGAATIIATLDSLLQQSGVTLDVIVVDDRSDDAGPAAARNHRVEPRVVSCLGTGRSAARNTGFRLARADHVVFLDADDRLHAHALCARARAARAAGQDAVIVAGYRHVLGSAARTCSVLGDVDGSGDARLALLRRNQLAIHCALLSRHRLAALAGEAPFRVGQHAFEDWDLWLRLAFLGVRFLPLGAVDCDYVLRTDMTNTATAAATEALAVLDRAEALARAAADDSVWHERAARQLRAARFELLLWRAMLHSREGHPGSALGDSLRAMTAGRDAVRELPALVADRAATRWWLWRAKRGLRTS